MAPSPDLDDVDLTQKDLAALLGTSTYTVRELAKKGILSRETSGRYRLTAVAEYAKHLASQAGPDDDRRHLLRQKDMARSIGISVQAFRAWDIKPEARVDGEALYAVSAVLEHHRHRIERELGGQQDWVDEESIDYWNLQKAKHAAEAQEMKNQVMRRELAPVKLLEWGLNAMARAVASQLDSMTMQVKKKMPQLSASELAVIDREKIKAQNRASKVQLPWEDLPDELRDTLGDE